MVDQSDWIILNRVRIQEVWNWLEERHNRLFPDTPSWDDGVPLLEPIVKRELLEVDGYRTVVGEHGLLTVYRLDSDDVLARNISADQLARLLSGEDTID